jgi:hypothetical protein
MIKIPNHHAKQEPEDQIDFNVKWANSIKRRFPHRKECNTEGGGRKGYVEEDSR